MLTSYSTDFMSISNTIFKNCTDDPEPVFCGGGIDNKTLAIVGTLLPLGLVRGGGPPLHTPPPPPHTHTFNQWGRPIDFSRSMASQSVGKDAILQHVMLSHL